MCSVWEWCTWWQTIALDKIFISKLETISVMTAFDFCWSTNVDVICTWKYPNWKLSMILQRHSWSVVSYVALNIGHNHNSSTCNWTNILIHNFVVCIVWRIEVYAHAQSSIVSFVERIYEHSPMCWFFSVQLKALSLCPGKEWNISGGLVVLRSADETLRRILGLHRHTCDQYHVYSVSKQRLNSIEVLCRMYDVDMALEFDYANNPNLYSNPMEAESKWHSEYLMLIWNSKWKWTYGMFVVIKPSDSDFTHWFVTISRMFSELNV